MDIDNWLEEAYEDRTYIEDEYDDIDEDSEEGCGKWGCKECYPAVPLAVRSLHYSLATS